MAKEKSGGAFSVLQRVGRSFMFPIALLPVAGLLLGIGSSFSNPTTIELYHLEWLLGEGTVFHIILSIMAATGNVIFGNLPLIFAMGVALGMAKQEKEIATLSAAVAFLVMHMTIATLLTLTHRTETLQEGATGNVLGLTSLEMGVFGGIIVGLGVAWLHNRFYRIELPNAISFFGGTRFIPIISTLVYILVGAVMFFLWPIIQKWIYALGDLVTKSGYAGTWIYGIIERALIPFGLHHVFYLPFWQTGLGGTMMIDGVNVAGAQNIFFAQLASPNTTRFSVEACRFMSGKFPFMMFGLPGAALAMYQCARKDKRKVAGGLLLGAALTSFLTGITEPLEFTFLFVAPLLYAVHCVLAGLSFMLMHIFGVAVGMTFSGGFIDLLLFGILPGNAKTNWIFIILVGAVYFIIYYFLFGVLIRKRNYKTPGREDEGEETKLYTRKDYNEAREKADSGNDRAAHILEALGGRENIKDLDCCATRLRITVAEPDKVNDAALKATGASGVIKKGGGIQVIYGPRVTVIKSELEDYLRETENQ
ncbi:MAG: PTS transporter subunit EIIC [Clostridia bacterium]|nr:PTS transporter subunit EIIC [Clostridia bacterium]